MDVGVLGDDAAVSDRRLTPKPGCATGLVLDWPLSSSVVQHHRQVSDRLSLGQVLPGSRNGVVVHNLYSARC